jgi:hypothetical protein
MAIKPIIDVKHCGKRVKVQFALEKKGIAMRYDIIVDAGQGWCLRRRGHALARRGNASGARRTTENKKNRRGLIGFVERHNRHRVFDVELISLNTMRSRCTIAVRGLRYDLQSALANGYACGVKKRRTYAKP